MVRPSHELRSFQIADDEAMIDIDKKLNHAICPSERRHGFERPMPIQRRRRLEKTPARNCCAITAKKNCARPACIHVRVHNTILQHRDCALTLPIESNRPGSAVFSKQHSVQITCSNLRVPRVLLQSREIALPLSIPAAGADGAIATKKDSVVSASGNLHVPRLAVKQLGNVELSV